MQPMSKMNTTNFDKSQKKLIKRISTLSSYEVIQDILGFYTCPTECGALCCTSGDIPLILDDKKRISSKGIGYRKIVKERTKTIQIVVDEEEVTHEVFTEHPCPFLHNERCSIHKFNPRICALYPFKTTKKTSSLLEIVACRLGTEIIMDFTSFELFMIMMSQDAQANMPQKLTEAIVMLKSMEAASQDDLSKALVVGVNDFEKLRFFLLYLTNETKESIIARRVELKKIADNKIIGC